MSEDNKYRVWVGCLACYNSGALVGDWFDAEDAPTSEQAFDEAIPGHRKYVNRDLYPHEELWVMDHENSPVAGEYSPNAAVQYAEWLESLEDDQRPAFDAWLKGTGNDFDEDAVGAFQDAYMGEYEGGYHGSTFVGMGYAESVINEELEQAKQIVNDCSKYSYDKRSTDWLLERIEKWGYLEDAKQRAWEMEANGEMVAYGPGPDNQAFCFRP